MLFFYLCVGRDCLKTQTSSVKIDTKLVKMALNMDLKDKKMTKKIVFRQSGEGGGGEVCPCFTAENGGQTLFKHCAGIKKGTDLA